MSSPNVDKTSEKILQKIVELNSLLKSVTSPEQKKAIGKYVEMLVKKTTNTAFDLMRKTSPIDKELSEVQKELMKEAISSWVSLIEKYEEMNFFVSQMGMVGLWNVIDKAMELGMKIGALTATGTITVREEMKKKVMENLKKTARKRGYII